MPTLDLIFEGVNAFVPNSARTQLTVVMPNASALGTSPKTDPYGGPAASHLPGYWTEIKVDEDPFRGEIEWFAGRRLGIRLPGEATTESNGTADLSSIAHEIGAAWLDVDPALIGAGASPDKVSGQFVIDRGIVSLVASPCTTVASQWTHGASTVPVVYELKVSIEADGLVELVDLDSEDREVFEELDLSESNRNLHLGNICAEDVLEWPQSVAAGGGGRTPDTDIGWLFNLQNTISAPFPRLEVEAGDLRDDLSPAAIFGQLSGPGAGLGCQCNSMIARAVG